MGDSINRSMDGIGRGLDTRSIPYTYPNADPSPTPKPQTPHPRTDPLAHWLTGDAELLGAVADDAVKVEGPQEPERLAGQPRLHLSISRPTSCDLSGLDTTAWTASCPCLSPSRFGSEVCLNLNARTKQNWLIVRMQARTPNVDRSSNPRSSNQHTQRTSHKHSKRRVSESGCGPTPHPPPPATSLPALAVEACWEKAGGHHAEGGLPAQRGRDALSARQEKGNNPRARGPSKGEGFFLAPAPPNAFPPFQSDLPSRTWCPARPRDRLPSCAAAARISWAWAAADSTPLAKLNKPQTKGNVQRRFRGEQQHPPPLPFRIPKPGRACGSSPRWWVGGYWGDASGCFGRSMGAAALGWGACLRHSVAAALACSSPGKATRGHRSFWRIRGALIGQPRRVLVGVASGWGLGWQQAACD